MACMCGDTQCPSCGPAQGNVRCPICGAWADDGCEHVGEDGQILPAFQDAADAAEAARAEADQRFAEEYLAERADHVIRELNLGKVAARTMREHIMNSWKTKAYTPNDDEGIES